MSLILWQFSVTCTCRFQPISHD